MKLKVINFLSKQRTFFYFKFYYFLDLNYNDRYSGINFYSMPKNKNLTKIINLIYI